MDCCVARKGWTLLELLVVMAIVAIALALLLVGVMRVRETASMAESKNNLRQIALATHHYATARHGVLPNLGVGATRFIRHPDGSQTAIAGPVRPALFLLIAPYLEVKTWVPEGRGMTFRPVGLFLSPSDPTGSAALAKGAAVTSYAANSEVFRDDPRLAGSFADGTSQTIAFAEHYAFDCNGGFFRYWENGLTSRHRPSFADTIDVIPVTQGNPPVTMPSAHPPASTSTFQVAPAPRNCEPLVPQTPHTAGMLVAMVDGSVRQLAPSIATPVFWGAVTPNGREILGGEW